MGRKVVRMEGQQVGHLTVLSLAESNAKGGAKWNVRCVCGTMKVIARSDLKKGLIKSCGCKQFESRFKHGHTSRSRERRTGTYTVWASMIARCENPQHAHYKNYGGRGITVCEAWRTDFRNFLMDMGEKPHGLSIERSNNDGPYEKANCRWASRLEQGANKRNNVLITIGEETMHASRWAQRYGLPHPVVIDRYKRKWPLDKLFAPLGTRIRPTGPKPKA